MRPLTPKFVCRSTLVRLTMALAVAAGLAFTTIQAQIPGRNVNMVSGTTYPLGDPFLQRQNEPSIAASTRNPLHLLAGANDYRTVDLPGLPDDEETGDAWLGLFKSFDGGDRWQSGLLPGFPQDSSCDPSKNANPDPAKCGLFGYQAAADPVVRAGTNGLLYYAGLVFDRGDNPKSAVFVARFIDNNNREDGDPIAHIGTSIVAAKPGTFSVLGTGTNKGKKFTLPTNEHLDKPWMAVDIPRPGAATCSVTTDGLNGPITQTVPAGMVYLAYSVFSGDGPTERSDIMFTRSADCGQTWNTPVMLSRKQDVFNQGATIAVDPATGSVTVAWRRFSVVNSGEDTDALMVSRSLDLGKKFSVPGKAHRFKAKKVGKIAYHLGRLLEHRKPKAPIVTENLTQEFDQATTPFNPITPVGSLSFRTNAYPTLAYDGQSRLYMAWSERGFGAARPDPDDGDGRIVISTSKTGVDWTPPAAISEEGQPGHQIMPSMTFAGGKLLVVYYDLREDRTQIYGPHIDDGSTIQALGRRHTIDIRTSMGKPGTVPVFEPSVRVSEYLMGYKESAPTVLSQLQANPPNLPNFKLGTVPFMGDYIDVAAAPAFVPIGNGNWKFNTDAGSTPVFHAVWTDNRDVKPPKPGTTWADYTPIGIAGPSLFDPFTIRAACTGNAGMRNQNIYTSRITGGLQVGSPGNTKPLSTELQRAFVVFARNATEDTLSFRMKIMNQPVGGRASFSQDTAGSPLTQIDVTTPRRSMASRTVFVTSTDPEARVDVEVTQIVAPGGAEIDGGLKGSVSLNADSENPGIQSDIENSDIENNEVHNSDIENSDIENSDIENSDIENSDIENNLISNSDIENSDIENSDIENSDIENSDIENSDIENSDIENGSLGENGVVTDVSWTINSQANTTSAYNVSMFLDQVTVPQGIQLQLVLRKIYKTPVAVDCDLKEIARNVLIANIINPVFLPSGAPLPDPNDPSYSNGSLWLEPGTSALITLRIADPDKTNNVFVDGVSIDPALLQVTPVIQQQADNGGTNAPPGIAGALKVTTFFLADAKATVPYSQTLRSSGGGLDPARTWSLVAGGLPAGLVLHPETGVLAGTIDPQSYGTFEFTVQVADQEEPANTDTQVLKLLVNPPPLDIVLPTEAARSARQGVRYALPLQAGGVAPLTWTVVAGDLPEGLTLSADGVIGGIPVAPGPSIFTVRVQDASGQEDTQEMCVRVSDQGGTEIVTQTLNSEGGPTLQDLVSTLLGPSVDAIEGTLSVTGDNNAAGTFQGATAVLGIEQGIVLGSGNVSGVPGPNVVGNRTTVFNGAGDADLDRISGRTTRDAIALEFDFEPSASRISFRYVFGSEEYNEYSGSVYDDVFGFFITRVNNNPENVIVNCAVVPGTQLPVSVNTINLDTNAAYFRNNVGAAEAINTEADGLTVVMACEADVIPGERYHMKLAIADATDWSWDSWVFIEGGSFGLTEICNNGVDDDLDGSTDGLDADCQVCHELGVITPEPVVIEVPGNSGGTVNPNQSPSGGPPVQAISLGPNEQVVVTATGFASFGGESQVSPDGNGEAANAQFLAPALPAFSLIARIGGGAWQLVGSGPTTLQAGAEGGYLEFAMNDNWHDDNSGFWTVSIQQEPPQP